MIIDEAARRDDIDAGERDIGFLRIAENIETALLELFTERHVDHRGIDFAGFERLAAHDLFAGALQNYIVPAQIEAEMFEPKQRGHPVGATDALNPENLAAQLFRRFDSWAGDHVVGHLAAERRQYAQVRFRDRRAEDAAATAVGDGNGSRLHRSDHQRCVADKNQGCVDAVFLEKAFLLGDPQRGDARIDRRVADGELGGAERGRRIRQHKREN